MPSLSIYDYAFLLTETADSPKHVAGLQIFRPPEDYAGDFVTDLMDAMRQRPAGPPFSFRLKGSLLGKPEWVEDENFDLDYHLRRSRLPRPGTRAQLMELVGRMHPVLLDRQRPLWELHFIDGLDDGCFAIYIKIHHSYCDGATLVQLLIETLNESPEDRRLHANWEATSVTSFRQCAVGGPGDWIGQGLGLLRTAIGAARDLGGMAGRMTLQRLGLQPGSLPVPFTAPRTKLNSVVTRARRVATGELPLTELKSISRTTGTTLNDVVVTICDIALTRYLRRHQQSPSGPLVAQMPVSLRRDGNDEMGNQLAILPVTLGRNGQDPLRRLKAVSRSCAEVKENAASMTSTAVSVYTLAMQGVAQASELVGISESLPPLGNILISNVPGPRKPLYLWGARLLSSYPISAIPPGLSMNITVFSYDGKFDIGIVAGYDAIPDIDVIPDYLVEAFRTLEAAAQRHSARAARIRGTAGRRGEKRTDKAPNRSGVNGGGGKATKGPTPGKRTTRPTASRRSGTARTSKSPPEASGR